ncbi:hypothetical protein E9993_00055 [Labilibacter sediminis]|nr:hypothetical protein E9993_00055 [Labilibacter sediminis]
MKKSILILCLLVVSLGILEAQKNNQTAPSDTTEVKSKAFDKEEKNRNVMLNAENNAGPREVNIGLPFTGDVTILENGNTVVGSFWPQNPLSVWRYDKSIGKIGLRNYQETAITTGVVGYTVDSHMREGTKKFRGFTEFKFNNRGRMYGSANVGGKVTDGLFYSASATVTRDPGATDLSVGKYADASEIFKFMLTKQFAKRKGKISLAYKHAEMSNIVDRFFPFEYHTDGSVKQIDGFDLGKDSFLPRDGKMTGVDPFTGKPFSYDMVKDNNTVSDVIDLMVDYRFKNKWRMKFSGRYHKATSDNAFVFPAQLADKTPGDALGQPLDGWQDLNGNAYEGPVAFNMSALNDNTPTQTIAGRLEFTKKINKHSLRFGTNYVGYSADFDNKNTFVYTSLEKNPRILRNTTQFPVYNWDGSFTMKQHTNDKGHIVGPYMDFTNFNLEYNHYNQQATAVYFSDDINVSRKFKLSVGGRAEYFSVDGDYFTKEQREANQAENPYVPFKGKPTDYHDSRWNFVGSASADYRLTSKVGLLGQYTVHVNGDRKNGYQNGLEADGKGTTITFMRLGAYLNHKKLNVVSALTSMRKTNLFSNASYTRPFEQIQSKRYATTYEIQTLGWTTDIIAKPFNNFELHYLLTLQKPQYKDYEITPEFPEWSGIPTETYKFSDNIIPGMSTVLMEIDPAYFLMERKLKLWGSLRYFNETQANAMNTLQFEARWETFAGVNYRVNKKLNVSVGMNNLLDQRGVRGKIQGSVIAKESDVEKYDGSMQVAQMLLPRMANLGIQYKF